MGGSLSREIDAEQLGARRAARATRIECRSGSGGESEGRDASHIDGAGDRRDGRARFRRLRPNARPAHLQRQLALRRRDQACAPDGGHFDLHIVDRTTYQVANPSIPTFDMVAKPGTTTVGFAYVMVSPRQDSGVLQLFPDSGVVDYDIMFQEFDVDAGVA